MISYWQAVTIICATFNARLAVKLTLESLLRNTDDRVRVIIADNGSTDGTWQELRRFRRLERVDSDRRARRLGFKHGLPTQERLHGATLDWLITQVRTPYFLTLDSDVEFLKPGWLPRLLDFAERNRLAALGEFDPGHGAYRPRLSPHVLLVNTEEFLKLRSTFRAFVLISDASEAKRWCAKEHDFCLDPRVMKSFRSARFYPTGSAFFERIILCKRPWGISSNQMTSDYRHFGHMSWALGTKSSARQAMADAHQRRENYIKHRLASY
jgi:glycosyltransferase involved in cell wall biosynthesis